MRLHEYLQSTPDPNRIKFVAQNVSSKFLAKKRLIMRDKNKNFSAMSIEDKKALVEMVFSGNRPDGSRMGVYIKWDEKNNWSFSIHGHFIDIEGLKPLSEDVKKRYFDDFTGGGHMQKELVTKSATH